MSREKIYDGVVEVLEKRFGVNGKISREMKLKDDLKADDNRGDYHAIACGLTMRFPIRMNYGKVLEAQTIFDLVDYVGQGLEEVT